MFTAYVCVWGGRGPASAGGKLSCSTQRDRPLSLSLFSARALTHTQVGFININDMYNNDVGKGGVRGYEAYEEK